MTVVRELVTVLRYQLDKSGLSEYLRGAGATAKKAAGKAKWFANEVRLGAKDAIHEWREMPPTVDRATQAQRRLNDAARQHTDAVRRTADGYVNLRRLAILTAGVFSVRSAFRGARNTIELASRYDELGIVMETVGRNAGYARPYLDELEQSLKDTGISALESRSNIAKLVAANIDLDKATQLARLAQDAAVIGGLNSSEAFARLTSGIQSAQVETLRTMGLNANFQKSYEDFAKEIGKTVGELTEFEKTQARTNAVLALAPTVAGAYEASMDNAGKQLRSASRYAEDLATNLGAAFQPAYEKAVFAYAGALKLAQQHTTEILRTIGLIGASWGLMRFQAGIAAIGGSFRASVVHAGGLGRAIFGLQRRGWAAVLPWLRMMAVVTAIAVVGQDVLTWLRGGESVLGAIIGRSEEWETQIQWVRDGLEGVKNALGGAGQPLGEWLRKWGLSGLVIYGVWRILRPVRRLLWGIASVILPLIAKELRLIATTPLGRFLSLWLAAVWALKWMYDNADKIAEKIRSAFDGALGRIGERLDELKEKFEGLIPDSVKGYFKENLGGNFFEQQEADILERLNRRSGRALQQPQSFNQSSDSTINQDITINAQTNSPSSLARLAGDEVGRQTGRAVRRGALMPNVEAMA